MKTLKKRNKKYNPEARYGKLTRDEYLMKPWQHLIPKQEQEPSEEESVAEATA
jgi:hypothetical protein